MSNQVVSQLETINALKKTINIHEQTIKSLEETVKIQIIKHQKEIQEII